MSAKDRVIELLKREGPLDVNTCMAMAFVSKGGISCMLSRMRKQTGDRVYIHSWLRAGKGHPLSVLAYGDAPEAPKPKKLTNEERCRGYRERRLAKVPPKRRISASRLAVENVLKEAPSTVEEIVDETGLHPVHVRGILSKTKRENISGMRTYVQKWVRDGRGPNTLCAVYALGTKKDAPKPKIGRYLSQKVYMKAYREGRKLKVASVFDLGAK